MNTKDIGNRTESSLIGNTVKEVPKEWLSCSFGDETRNFLRILCQDKVGTFWFYPMNKIIETKYSKDFIDTEVENMGSVEEAIYNRRFFSFMVELPKHLAVHIASIKASK